MTPTLDDLARLGWAQFWQVTAVAIVAGSMARLFGRNHPRLAYALWMLVLVKALTPPIWSSPTGVFSWALTEWKRPPREHLEQTERVPAPIVVSSPTPAPPIPVDDPPILIPDDRPSTATILLWMWGAGLVTCLVLAIGKQAACWILLRRSRLPVNDDLIAMRDDLRRRLGIRRQVRLIVSARPIGPAAFGLLRPTIVLPKVLLDERSPEQVELILAHELIHIRRGDVLAGMLQIAAQAAWWFHPLIWWTNREATRERERCCDRDVVEGVGCRPGVYARTLLGVLELKSRLRIPAAIAGVRAMEVTSRRLEAIMRHDERGRRQGTWIARIAFACGAILLIPGAGLTFQADADEKPKAESTEAKADSKAAADLKKAEQELKWAEGMYEKKYIGKVRLEEARRKLLELKVSALEEEILRSQIGLAKSDLVLAEERADLARKLEDQGESTKYWKMSEELSLQQARFRLEVAEGRLDVYLRYTKPKREREEQAQDEREAAQRLALAARTNADAAKGSTAQPVQDPSSPKEVKSVWEVRAERRLKQGIDAIRNELSLAQSDVKRHEDRVDWAGKMREKGYVSEAQFKSEKQALQKANDHLKEMQGKLEELQKGLITTAQAKAFKNQVTIVDAPQEVATMITLKGIARERGTGQPVEGARISFDEDHWTISGKGGRYEFNDIPSSEEYSLVGGMSGGPFFISSARIKPTSKDQKMVDLDLDFVRGIPFRVRVLDKATGKPLLDPKTGKTLRGGISYFPVAPNDPYQRGAWGYSKTREDGLIGGAHYEAFTVDENGEYRGAVLPGPGVLCFSVLGAKRTQVVTEHQPSLFYPDGHDAVRIASYQNPKCSIVDLPIRGSKSYLGIALNQYAAVIAINPKEDAKEVSYEIELDQAEVMK